LTAIQLDAQNIANRLGTQSAEVTASIESITRSAGQIHNGIRQMVHSLQPALLDELGLPDSLQEMVTQWQALNPDIACDLQLDGQLDDVHKPLAITVYRLVQEGLTNVSKHANASQVQIQVRRAYEKQSQKDRLSLSVEDNGIGMSPSVANEGLGLLGMRERVLSLGGEFEITDAKNTAQCKGVCIYAHFDIAAGAT
jgi:two-component system sensor histidine kinase UhpB